MVRGPHGRLVVPNGSPSLDKEFTYLLTYLEPLFQKGVWIENQNTLFVNIVDPDETAHYEPSHQDLQCLQKVCFGLRGWRVKIKFPLSIEYLVDYMYQINSVICLFMLVILWDIPNTFYAWAFCRPFCLVCVTVQSTHWGHVDFGQFTIPHIYWAGWVL